MSGTVEATAEVETGFVVENPPSSCHTSGRRTAWGPLLERVRTEGGEWCRVAEYDGDNRAQRASSLRAWLKASPLGRGFEFCTRRVTLPDSRRVCRLYARLAAVSPSATETRSEAVLPSATEG